MRVNSDFPLSELAWYKIGGTAKYLLEVYSKEDIVEAYTFIQNNSISEWFIMGRGANLLISDNNFDGAIIHVTESNPSSINMLNDTHIEAYAGEDLDTVIQYAFTNNLIGLEWAGGLPGTVGAAVRGNVGAFGVEIKDVIDSADVIDLYSGKVKKLKNKDLFFSYRESEIKRNRSLLVTSCVFKLKKGNPKEVKSARETYGKNMYYREIHHPLEHPNCGSVFKNIKKPEDIEKILIAYPDLISDIQTKWHGKVSMGYLIRRLGFSGFQIGRAQVSEKHCNFIINLGGAAFEDVLKIITEISDKFQETFEFRPELEVEVVRF